MAAFTRPLAFVTAAAVLAGVTVSIAWRVFHRAPVPAAEPIEVMALLESELPPPASPDAFEAAPGEPREEAAPKRGITAARLKAIFVDRFVGFAHWPTGAWKGSGPFELCIAGAGATPDALAGYASSRLWQGRPVVVRRVGDVDQLAGCHLLFVGASARAALDRILAATRDRPILTVADTPGFGARGVMINLVRVGKYMRFELDPSAPRGGITLDDALTRHATPATPLATSALRVVR
jgi:hypothetical protein